jgi:phosphate/sulfate permease
MLSSPVVTDEMSHSRPTPKITIDPLKIAIGVFVVLGVVLTAVAGYALIETLGGGLGAIPPELAMTAVFGAFLLVTAAATRRHVPHR